MDGLDIAGLVLNITSLLPVTLCLMEMYLFRRWKFQLHRFIGVAMLISFPYTVMAIQTSVHEGNNVSIICGTRAFAEGLGSFVRLLEVGFCIFVVAALRSRRRLLSRPAEVMVYLVLGGFSLLWSLIFGVVCQKLCDSRFQCVGILTKLWNIDYATGGAGLLAWLGTRALIWRHQREWAKPLDESLYTRIGRLRKLRLRRAEQEAFQATFQPLSPYMLLFIIYIAIEWATDIVTQQTVENELQLFLCIRNFGMAAAYLRVPEHRGVLHWSTIVYRWRYLRGRAQRRRGSALKAVRPAGALRFAEQASVRLLAAEPEDDEAADSSEDERAVEARELAEQERQLAAENVAAEVEERESLRSYAGEDELEDGSYKDSCQEEAGGLSSRMANARVD